MSQIRTTSLSPARRRLLRLMSEMGFGRIEGLQIQDGEPVLDPMPRILRTIKLDDEHGCKPGPKDGDYAIREQAAQLLKRIDRLGNGTVDSLEIQHGLPFRMVIEGAGGLGGEVEP